MIVRTVNWKLSRNFKLLIDTPLVNLFLNWVLSVWNDSIYFCLDLQTTSCSLQRRPWKNAPTISDTDLEGEKELELLIVFICHHQAIKKTNSHLSTLHCFPFIFYCIYVCLHFYQFFFMLRVCQYSIFYFWFNRERKKMYNRKSSFSVFSYIECKKKP